MSDSRADGSEADDGARCHDRGRDSSRHPPRSGGTPPRPRTRMAAAMIPANDKAAMARRNIFTMTKLASQRQNRDANSVTGAIT